jgi:WD40-like Beta Propeller Repeat
MCIALLAILLHAVPDLAPAPSRIVFASTRTTVSQLYSVEPSGEGMAQLTFGTAGFEAPLPSPDGRFVAASSHGDLWVMRADGGDRRLLAHTATDGFSWSASSERLVFASAQGAIWTVSVATGRRRQITLGQEGASPSEPRHDRSPSLSPNGRAIAFTRCCYWDRTPAPATALVVRRNGVDNVLTYYVSGPPSWSPDGRWIAISSQDGSSLELVRPGGGTTRVHVASVHGCWYCGGTGTGGVAWSPNGRFLAFDDGDGLHVVPRSGGAPRLHVAGLFGQGVAWSPAGDGIVLPTTGGIERVTLRGETKTLVRFEQGDVQPGVGWAPGREGLRYRAPEEVPLLVHVSARELEARFPIRQISADGDRVAYWICQHALGVWRPGDSDQLPLGERTLQACLAPRDPYFHPAIYDLALACDRLAYLTSFAGNEVHTTLMLATLEHGTEGVDVAEGARPSGQPDPETLTDVVGGGSALVYGSRGSWIGSVYPPESIWRIDGEKPVQIATRRFDVRPLDVDQGRILAQSGEGRLEVLDLNGSALATFTVPAVASALAGDDLVVLVQGQLRDYSVSTSDLLHAWPLPDIRSAGRCLVPYCAQARLRLEGAARGLALYTLDGTFHLLRLRDGADVPMPAVTAAELTDAGLFSAYVGAEPWPGRIRFVPFAELPL